MVNFYSEHMSQIYFYFNTTSVSRKMSDKIEHCLVFPFNNTPVIGSQTNILWFVSVLMLAVHCPNRNPPYIC